MGFCCSVQLDLTGSGHFLELLCYCRLGRRGGGKAVSPSAFPGLWQLACSLSFSDTVDLLKSRSGSKRGCGGLLQTSGKENVESIRETQEKQKRDTGVPMTVTGHMIPLGLHGKYLDRFSEFLLELSTKTGLICNHIQPPGSPPLAESSSGYKLHCPSRNSRLSHREFSMCKMLRSC